MTKRCKITIFSGENGTLGGVYLPIHRYLLEYLTVYGICQPSDLSLKGQALFNREQRLRFLVQLSQQLSPEQQAEKLASNEVFGCEARVWVHCEWQRGLLQLQINSEARLVKGLLALIQQALHGANAEQVAAYQLDAHFSLLGLDDYLTVSRRNGLRAAVAAIQASVRNKVSTNEVNP